MKTNVIIAHLLRSLDVDKVSFHYLIRYLAGKTGLSLTLREKLSRKAKERAMNGLCSSPSFFIDQLFGVRITQSEGEPFVTHWDSQLDLIQANLLVEIGDQASATWQEMPDAIPQDAGTYVRGWPAFPQG